LSLDEICDLQNPSVMTSFSSIIHDDDGDNSGSPLDDDKPPIAVHFPVGEYIFQNEKSGEAHWLNSKTADSWPLGPTGNSPVRLSPMKSNINVEHNVSISTMCFLCLCFNVSACV
jgi:hypothetical protein